MMKVELNTDENASLKYGEIVSKVVRVKFQIPNFSVTGFQVKFIRIGETTGYKAAKYIRYTTKSDRYLIQID